MGCGNLLPDQTRTTVWKPPFTDPRKCRGLAKERGFPDLLWFVLQTDRNKWEEIGTIGVFPQTALTLQALFFFSSISLFFSSSDSPCFFWPFFLPFPRLLGGSAKRKTLAFFGVSLAFFFKKARVGGSGKERKSEQIGRKRWNRNKSAHIGETPFPEGPKDQKNSRFRARLKIFEREWNFRASHPPQPYFCGEFETSRLKPSSEIRNFDRDWKLRARLNFFDCWLREPFSGVVGNGCFLTPKPSFPTFGHFGPCKGQTHS